MEDTRKVMLHLRDNVQRKLLVLLAMCLGIPEQDLLDSHKPGASKSEYYRYVSNNRLTQNFTTMLTNGTNPPDELRTPF